MSELKVSYKNKAWYRGVEVFRYLGWFIALGIAFLYVAGSQQSGQSFNWHAFLIVATIVGFVVEMIRWTIIFIATGDAKQQ